MVERGEVPVGNALGRALSDELGPPPLIGYLLLSDRALYAYFPDDPSATLPAPGQSWRMPLATISHVAPAREHGPPVLRLEWVDDSGEGHHLIFDLHVSAGDDPLKQRFYDALVKAVTEAHT
jgi:hypothetical protein